MDIESWLRALGLERYVESFRESEIDAEVLPKLTDDNLKELGLPLGPRLKLLEAISRLSDDSGSSSLARAPPVVAAALPAPGAGRRQLTLMFVDLVGSTELSARLDPEEMSEVLRLYRVEVAAKVARFDGHVAKYMGDGVLAYFGWPVAHEHEAERAVRAGLAVAEGVATILPVGGSPLSARVGIATGPVVVGELVGSDDARERTVVGETPNLAARLQGLADPGSVVIAEATRNLLGDLFVYRNLGPAHLRGFAEAVAAYQVLGEGLAEDRFEAMHAHGLSPLIGRSHELSLLLDRWERAKEGEGQVVLLSGEAGIGKSRLLRALRERLAAEPHTSRAQFCSPYHANTPLHPVIGLLERAAGLRRDDPPERQLDKLEAMLALATADVRGVASLLADLLSISNTGRYPPIELSSEQKKERTFQVLLDQLVGRAARGPALTLYEDVHWADPTTLELLGRVVERVQHLPVLVLITFRPGFSPPWTGRGHVGALSLGRLGRSQGGAIVDRLSGGKILPAEVLEQILARTDGVPLFVEELTKAILESDLLADKGDHYELNGPLPPLAIPATLHDSLMTRLDRLAAAKVVAQLAACIGREFSHVLISAVAALTPAELDRALGELVAAELVFASGTPPDAVYIFKHALVQDAAYQSLLRSQRLQLHARIGAVLEEQFPDLVEAQPGILARHFAEAGLLEKAVVYLYRAARHSVARWAMAEAITQLKLGLEMLPGLPDEQARRQHELDFQTALGVPLMATRGMGHADVEKAYARARRLCFELGESPQLFSVLFGLWWFYELNANLSTALELAKQLLDIAERENDSARLMQAHRALACTYYWLGEFASAQPHFDDAIALYDPQHHRSLAFTYGQEPGVLAYGFGAHNLWFLGYPDRALNTMNKALALAREAAHPFSLAFALDHLTWLHQYRLERTEALEVAKADIEFSTEQGLQFFLAQGTILRGWALAETGDVELGTLQIQRGLITLQSTGVRSTRTYWVLLLAWLHAKRGHVKDSFRLCDEASAPVGDQHLWDAELHRLRGELILLSHDPETLEANGSVTEAEICFRQAIIISRRQHAKSLELRAAASLARLWAAEGRCVEARELLLPIYQSFTEGFETPEIRQVAVLLDSLQ